MNSWFSCILYPGVLYTALYLVDSAARHYHPLKYSRFCRTSGIEIGLFQVKWFTESFNASLLKFGRSCPHLLSSWFLLGAILASSLIPVAVYILIMNLIRELGLVDGSGDGSNGDQLVIQPILPGVNIPNSELGYYFISLLVCSVYHELGHAVSAVSENIRVLGFGVFVLFIIPAAYVDLPTEQLTVKTNLQKLRVFSAGVWHNIILAAISYLLLIGCPTLLSPLYRYGSSPCVVGVTPESPVTGPSGLKSGDVITKMQSLIVHNKTDFRDHILTSIQNPPHGLCINKEKVEALESIDDADCCALNSESSTSLCFQIYNQQHLTSSRCLPARALLLESGEGVGCWSSESTCPVGYACAVPVFNNNNTKFIQINRENDKEFLYVGNPAFIYSSVQLSDYCPRYSMLPSFLPEILMKLFSYVMSFSSALALLNVVPSLLLDGQHMILVLLDILLVGRFKIYSKQLQVLMTVLGTFLVVVNISLGFYRVVLTGSTNVFIT